MASLSRGFCTACGYESPIISDPPADGLFVDDPSAGKPLMACEDDSRILLIIHPIEEFVFARHGLTEHSATWQGRFVRISEWFCKSCGHFYESRELAASPAVFAFPMVGFGLGIGILVGVLWSNFVGGVVTGMLSLIVGIAVIERAVGSYVRTKFPERAKEIHRARVCPRCNSHRAVKRGTVTCPACHQRTMKIRIWGVS